MEDIKKIDSAISDWGKSAHSILALEIRDKSGAMPMKIRTTVFTKRENGETHMTEIENTIDADVYEEAYQEWLARVVVEQAKRIVSDLHKNET